MRDLIERGLEAARRAGASYADLRIIRQRSQGVAVVDRSLGRISDTEDFGFGVRALVNGTWGFAASSQLDPEELERVARQAVLLARASSRWGAGGVVLPPEAAARGTFRTPVTRDPFAVGLTEKVDLLRAANDAALGVPGIEGCYSDMYLVQDSRWFGSTEGAAWDAELFRVWPSVSVTAVASDGRGYETCKIDTPPMGCGYEFIEECDLAALARARASECVEKLRSPSVQPGRRAVILDSSNLWLTLHESVGHATEADRAVGQEANNYGTSFCTPEKRGHFRYASELVTIRGDRSTPRGLCTRPFDDEGVPAVDFDIIRDGIFVGYQTTREFAPLVGEERSTACAYASTWGAVPLERMPNVSMLPARSTCSVADVISATDDGIYIVGDGSFSIDQQRSNFQFTGQLFWEVKHGKLTHMVRDVAYQAATVDFWRACDLVGGPETWRLWGMLACGKGEPSQVGPASHGCPVARFHDVQVLDVRGLDAD